MKTTAKNEIQVTLQEYLGRRKAEGVADEILVAMQGESQHMHGGTRFYVHAENGELMLTTESVVESRVEEILHKHLEESDAQECFEALMEEQEQLSFHIVLDESVNETQIHPFETIKVEGSSSRAYAKLLEYEPENEAEHLFLKRLKTAINAQVGAFEVPVCDPSIDEDGNLQFVPGKKPAVGLSYNEIEELAKKNGLHHGDFNQWHLFCGTMSGRVMEEYGWSLSKALYAICKNSRELGHYCDSPDAKHELEPTGSRMIAGKCDLGNTCKILAKDESAGGGFWLAGGSYKHDGNYCPLACLDLYCDYDGHCNIGVGWFVL